MGTQRGGSVSASPKMCPKREEEERKEREVSDSSHSASLLVQMKATLLKSLMSL